MESQNGQSALLGTGNPTFNQRKRKKLEQRIVNKLKSVRWYAIIRALKATPLTVLDNGKRGHVIAIGSRTMLTPSEKFYCAESDRRTELDKEADNRWWDMFVAQASDHRIRVVIRWVDGEPIVFAVKEGY